MSSSRVDISSLKVLKDALESTYGFELQEYYVDVVARRLEQLGFLTRISDQYAGTYFVPMGSVNVLLRMSAIAKNSPESQLAKAFEGGDRLLSRAFQNNQFWTDLKSEMEGGREDNDSRGKGDVEVPASDRVVTLSHNQQIELEESTSSVIDELSKENAIDGDSSLRDTVLGQFRAGRELIRAQTFKVYLLQEMLMSVLGSLIERYKDQALGVAAKKLLELLIEHIFGK